MEQPPRTQKSPQIDLPLQNPSQRTGHPEDLHQAKYKPIKTSLGTTSSSNFTIPTWTHSQTHISYGLSKTGTNYPNQPLIKPPRPLSNRAFSPSSFNFPCDHPPPVKTSTRSPTEEKQRSTSTKYLNRFNESPNLEQDSLIMVVRLSVSLLRHNAALSVID